MRRQPDPLLSIAIVIAWTAVAVLMFYAGLVVHR